MFHVGQKVVCVKRGTWTYEHKFSKTDIFPRYGDILTVRSIHEGRWLQFEEIRNPLSRTNKQGQRVENCFEGCRFRPLKHKDTSHQVEQLKRLLLPKPEKAKEQV